MNVNSLQEVMNRQPVSPSIHEADFALRKNPWYSLERRLLDYLLIYIQEGECVISVEGKEYRAKNGDFCLVQPNSLHTLRGGANTITPYVHFDIFQSESRNPLPTNWARLVDLTGYTEWVQPRLNDLWDMNPIPVVFHPKQPIPFKDRLLHLIRCWLNPSPLKQLEARAELFQLVFALIQDYSKPVFESSPDITELNWITSYFDFRLSEPISIEDMARRAHLSVSRFRKSFFEQFGVSPHQYLIQMRLRAACDLLKTTRWPLQKIATYCGFADVHHFAKTFKRKLGRTPGEYRALHSMEAE